MASAMGPHQLKDEIIQGLLNRNTSLREEVLKKDESFLKKEREFSDLTKELHQEKGNALEIHEKLLRRETDHSTTVAGLKEVIPRCQSSQTRGGWTVARGAKEEQIEERRN
jgi:hypothetical protein